MIVLPQTADEYLAYAANWMVESPTDLDTNRWVNERAMREQLRVPPCFIVVLETLSMRQLRIEDEYLVYTSAWPK